MNCLFETERLTVSEFVAADTEAGERAFLNQVISVLTPAVAENLPDYFHGINTSQTAGEWLERMLAESRLFTVAHQQSADLAGFIFVYGSDAPNVHLGYLLKESEWGKGLASEMLTGFIDYAGEETAWEVLIAGVDPANVASAGLLKKLNFIRQPVADEGSHFYHYLFNR